MDRGINEILNFIGIQIVPIDIVYQFIDVLNSDREDDIPIHPIDAKTIIGNSLFAQIAAYEYQGKEAAFKVMNHVVSLLDLNNEIKLQKFSGALIHFQMSPEYDFMKLAAAMDILHGLKEDADFVFFTTTDKNLPIDFMRITAFAFDAEKIYPLNRVDYEK